MVDNYIYKEEGYRILGACFVEIKSVSDLADIHRAQVINYRKATEFKVGYLVNFSHDPRIQHERLILGKAR